MRKLIRYKSDIDQTSNRILRRALTGISPRWNYLRQHKGTSKPGKSPQPFATAIILDLCVPSRAAVDVSPNRRSYRAKLLSAALTYSRTSDGAPVGGCCRKLAHIMGQIKGACGQSLSASCTMRKITRPEYVCMCVWLCKYALRRALTKRRASLSLSET